MLLSSVSVVTAIAVLSLWCLAWVAAVQATRPLKLRNLVAKLVCSWGIWVAVAVALLVLVGKALQKDLLMDAPTYALAIVPLTLLVSLPPLLFSMSGAVAVSVAQQPSETIYVYSLVCIAVYVLCLLLLK
jgi:hypothetical protein